MKNFICLVMLLAPLTLNAEYSGGHTPKRMYGAGEIKFGIDNPPGDVCGYHGRHFILDATTESGKNILSILISAMMAKKEVDIWYTPSSAPGTTEDSGCGLGTMAVICSIGIQ